MAGELIIHILAVMNYSFRERLARISSAICPIFLPQNRQRYLKTVAVLAAGILTTHFAMAAQIIWSGAGDLNWSTAGNWFGGVVPSATDDVKFYDDGALANNNLDAAFAGTIQSLQYSQTNGTHNTIIAPGKTLTINSNFVTGTEAIAAGNLSTIISGVGGGLSMNNPAAYLVVRQGGDTTSRRATLDMSGLDTLSVNVNQVFIGRADPPGGFANINRNTGYLFLARTNRLTARTSFTGSLNVIGIEVGRSGSNNGNGSRLYLGQTNEIYANSIGVGMEKETGCQMIFNTALFTDSVAYIRGSDGLSSVNLWTIGDGEANSGTTSCQGTADFTGGTLNALVDTMTIGRASANTSGTGNSRGTLTMAAGTLDVNTMQVGIQTLNTSKNGDGTVNINGGKLIVNNSLDLGVATGGAGVATTKGRLIVTSAEADINAITTGAQSGDSSITLTTATLILTNTAGSTAATLGTLSVSDSTLNLQTVGAAARVIVTNLITGGAGNTISVGLLPAITTYPATFPLIKYQGVIGGSGFNFTLTGLSGTYTGSLVDNSGAGSVDLVITAGPIAQAITWDGTINGDWNTTTKNWRFGAISTNYFDGDFPTFNDSATGPTTVNLATTLHPGSVTVNNNTKLYTITGSGGVNSLGGLTKQGSGTLVLQNSGANSFASGAVVSSGTLQIGNGGTSGALSGNISDNAAVVFNRSDNLTADGDISGSGSVSKNGAGVLTLSGNNTFNGAVTVAQGTLQGGSSSALGSTNGTTTINSGATLDIGANNVNFGLERISASGAGVGGQGAIVNNSGSATFVGPNIAFLTLTGDTVFGGTGRWDLRAAGGTTGDPATASLSTSGQAYKVTKTGSNIVNIVSTTVDPALGDIDIQQGTVSFEGNTTSAGNPAKTLTVESGATLRFFQWTNLLNKQIVLNGSGTNNTVDNNSGVNTVIGPISLNGDCWISAGGTSLTLSNTIGGTGNLIKIGGSPLILAGGSDSYTGNTTVSNGTLVLNNIISGGGTLTTVTNTTLGGNGTNTGAVFVGGNLQPGGTALAGTFGSGSLTLQPGATATFDLAPVNTIGSGVNDLVQVTGDLNVNNTAITISLLQGNLQAGSYRLFNYTGNLVGSFAPSVTLGGGASRFTLSLDTSTPGQVNLVVSGSTANLRWNSASDSTWDIATTANWFNLGTSLNDVFYQADKVLLDDTAGLQTTLNIPAGVSVVPTVITNKSDANYFTISGAGKISGGATIVKQGASTLTISTTNDYTGTVTVEAGTLQVGSSAALGSTAGATIVKSGATLDFGSLNFVANALNLGLEPITVSGAGVFSQGAIINSGSLAQQNAVRVVTLVGDTTFGGSGRWDIRGTGATLSTGGQPYNITKVGANQVSLVGVAVDPALGNIDVQGGIFSIETSTTSAGNPTKTLTVESGATLQLFQLAVALNKVIILNGDSVTTTFNNNSGVNTISGSITLTGGCIFNVGGTSLALSGAIGGSGGLVKNGASPMSLTGAVSYTGDTTINGGRLALSGSASISSSPNITLGGGTLDVGGRSDGKQTIVIGHTILGNGRIDGSLQVNAGATVSPGNDSLGLPIGVLTVSNVVTLEGTNVMQTEKASFTNDMIAGAASIIFGGVLRVSDDFSIAYADGDSFKFFSAGSYFGSFSSIEPANPGPGLFWDTSQLTVSGTLKVVSTPAPRITGTVISGNNFVFSGSGGAPNASYSVLTSTNAALPLAQWTLAGTDHFDASGNFSFTTAIAKPQQYFILQVP
jgi:fibronectin-binding autotransporter adhesin